MNQVTEKLIEKLIAHLGFDQRRAEATERAIVAHYSRAPGESFEWKVPRPLNRTLADLVARELDPTSVTGIPTATLFFRRFRPAGSLSSWVRLHSIVGYDGKLVWEFGQETEARSQPTMQGTEAVERELVEGVTDDVTMLLHLAGKVGTSSTT